MTPEQQNRAKLIGFSFLILYFSYLYNRITNLHFTPMQFITRLVLGIIAFVATIATGQMIHDEGLLSGDKDQFVHILTLFAIFIFYTWIFHSLKRMI
jgi:hypothetical protein